MGAASEEDVTPIQDLVRDGHLGVALALEEVHPVASVEDFLVVEVHPVVAVLVEVFKENK